MAPKRARETLEDALSRVWCYYCERDFPGVKDLCDHQRAIHFRCTYDPRACSRKLQTAGGLQVHMQQVHKSELKSVPGAMAGREAILPEIFGMEGVPVDLVDLHKNRIIREFQLAEAEHLKKTGNSLSGANAPNKKPKVEAINPADVEATNERARLFKERRLLHKKLKAEAAARGEAPPVFEKWSPHDIKPTPPQNVAPVIQEQPAHISPPAATAPAIVAPPSASPPVASAPYMPPVHGLPNLANFTQQPRQTYGNFPPIPPGRSATGYNWTAPPPHHSYPPAGDAYQPAYNPSPVNHMPQHFPGPPAPDHSVDRFREQHPRHGLPSIPPPQMPTPTISPPSKSIISTCSNMY